MSKKIDDCHICMKGKIGKVWMPFVSGQRFWTNLSKVDHEDCIGICMDCKSRIFKLLRSNGEAFSESVTIGDVCKVVRKAFRL